MIRGLWRVAALFVPLAFAGGCGRSDTMGSAGTPAHVPQVYRYGNSAEPQDIDPQVVQGVPENHIIQSLLEGMVTPDPK
ncbi:MAG TPA: peptide ABC transporter substrate-binding protein, partial [Opitutaceae bacterium]